MKNILLLLLSLALLFALAMGLLVWAEKRVAPSQDEDRILIVLGAQVKPSGEPSVQLALRLETALRAYQAAPRLVVVCGAQGADEPLAEGEAMRGWLIARGAAPEDILAETASRSTRQNLENAAALVPPGARVTVVTSDYHLPRALAIAREIGLDADGLPAPCRKGLSFWLKNHSRETLAWGKFLLEKILR